MQRIKQIYLFIIIGIGLFILFTIILIKGYSSKKDNLPARPAISIYPTFALSPTTVFKKEKIILPTITINFVDPKIKINDVEVNNFYRHYQKMNIKNDVLIVNKKNYQIVYLTSFQQFLIDILDSPFEQNRKAAENEFLTMLGVIEKDACRLKVRISTSYFINSEEANEVYPLSFCQS